MMTDIAHSWLKMIAPPILVESWRRVRKQGIYFHGPYINWQEATRHSSGYDSMRILEKVREATRKVVRGEVAAERDSVPLPEVPYPYPLIAILLRTALERNGELTVMDFGGALGSAYHQCAYFLQGLHRLRWNIVEQPIFVECGKKEFQSESLRFFEKIDSAISECQPDVILLSGVLQYLPDPILMLRRLAEVGARHIVIDRTPISTSGRDQIAVQVVPETIAESSYPAWTFSKKSIVQCLSPSYVERAEFDAVDGVLGHSSLRVKYKGFIFEKSVRQKAL